jgi:hypothetical protein
MLLSQVSCQILPKVKPPISNEKFIERLEISRRTAQTWRDEGLIEFFQIGSKIFYTEEGIEKFLNNHKINQSNHKGGPRNGRG